MRGPWFCQYAVADDGRKVTVVWAEVLRPGRIKIDLRSLPDGTQVYDAMGNNLVRSGADFAEVVMVPLFVVHTAASRPAVRCDRTRRAL